MNQFTTKFATPDRHFSFPDAYKDAEFSYDTANSLGQNPNLSDDHIKKIIGGTAFGIQKTLARHVPQKHIDDMIGDEDLHHLLSRNPNLSDDHFKTLFEGGHNRSVLLENPSLPSHMMDEHLAKNDSFIDMDLAGNPSLSKEHMHTILDRGDSNPIAILAANPASHQHSDVVDRLIDASTQKGMFHRNSIKRIKTLTNDQRKRLDTYL